jgi:DNA-directed RNA polymerase subunit RPC12/RpoP
MSKSDYRRPADYQVERDYRCRRCGHEQRPLAGDSAMMPCPQCGGYVEMIGESYPSNADDWDESRDDINGDWHNERRNNR